MQRAKRFGRGDRPWMWLGRLGTTLLLALALGSSLGACGGGDEAEVETGPVEDAEAPAEGEEGNDADAAVDEGDADEPGAGESEDAPSADPTDAPTEAPTATEEPTDVPTEAPTDPPTAVPATPAPTNPPEPTAAPAAEWFVEFYPDNWTYQIPKDQLCAGINWRSAGVTDLVVGRVGGAGESVEAEGKKGDNCFSEKEAEFFLEYKRPDGQVERKEFKIERTKNKSD